MEQRSSPVRLSSVLSGAGSKSKILARDIAESLGKLPPQALDLEEAILGALMLEKNALTNVVEFLRPEHFLEDRSPSTTRRRELRTPARSLFQAWALPPRTSS